MSVCSCVHQIGLSSVTMGSTVGAGEATTWFGGPSCTTVGDQHKGIYIVLQSMYRHNVWKKGDWRSFGALHQHNRHAFLYEMEKATGKIYCREQSLNPTGSLLPVVPIQCLIRYMSIIPLRTPDLLLLDGEPSYSHLMGGSLSRWVLAALGGNLVPS